MNFTSLGWFTLATVRKLLAAEDYRQLRDAIRFKEIPITRVGSEYWLDHEDWLAWRASIEASAKPLEA
ncbi:hypothetical protein [Lacipirellula parvula]|uniref:hypothetical protein n=1 Tax=Lacipirellula parvula TaxID=2650471 RepID=UPI001E5B63DA|nr:hypothetical protein [Lacipirellula parvula]